MSLFSGGSGRLGVLTVGDDIEQDDDDEGDRDEDGQPSTENRYLPSTTKTNTKTMRFQIISDHSK